MPAGLCPPELALTPGSFALPLEFHRQGPSAIKIINHIRTGRVNH